MEKAMSVEDKIRRAEEIYYRRRQTNMPRNEEIRTIPRKKKDIKLFRKLVIQIIICLTIYAIFYLIINNNYIFSEDFSNKMKEILAQDINFSEIYSFITNKVEELTKPKDNQQEETNQNEEKQNEEQKEENLQNNDENIGGAEELLTNGEQNVDNSIAENTETPVNPEETSQLTQMEQDANHVKSTVSFIKPVVGTISSGFGGRNPTTPTVPKNHTGTDIAANTGTKIVSATDGTVILSSEQGDYGKHLKIQINDVVIVYAHCNKLYVGQGDTIKQGQEIAEVGATGNVTGPHLHFEVRYQDRYIDPQMILEL